MPFMENHALLVLADAESWNWPVAPRIQQTRKQGAKYEANTPKLLYWLIKESQRFGVTNSEQFWDQVRLCHPRLKGNGAFRLFWSDILVKPTCPVDNLSRNSEAVPYNQSSNVLFEGIHLNEVDFKPIFDMAAEYFTHLGIACKRTTIPTETLTHDLMVVMNPRGPKSGSGTPHSVSDIANMETDKLLAVVEGTGFGV